MKNIHFIRTVQQCRRAILQDTTWKTSRLENHRQYLGVTPLLVIKKFQIFGGKVGLRRWNTTIRPLLYCMRIIHNIPVYHTEYEKLKILLQYWYILWTVNQATSNPLVVCCLLSPRRCCRPHISDRSQTRDWQIIAKENIIYETAITGHPQIFFWMVSVPNTLYHDDTVSIDFC